MASCASAVQGFEDILSRNVLTIDVIEDTIVCLGHDGISVPIVLKERGIVMMTVHPLPCRVAHSTYAARVGNEDRGFKKSGFCDPVCACHITIAVEGIPGGIDGIEFFATGKDRSNAGPHRAFSFHQGPISFYDRGLAYRDTRYVGDGI